MPSSVSQHTQALQGGAAPSGVPWAGLGSLQLLVMLRHSNCTFQGGRAALATAGPVSSHCTVIHLLQPHFLPPEHWGC